MGRFFLLFGWFFRMKVNQSLSNHPDQFPACWASVWGLDSYGYWQSFEVNGARQVMRWIPPGSFLMGSPESEPGRRDNEGQHSVSLNDGFWLGDTACTQGLWQAVMGENPSYFDQGDDYPVEQVSWKDCQRFIEELQSHVPSLPLGLPSEAQWEYACRARSNTAFSWGNELSVEQARYDYGWPYNGGKKRESARGPVEVLHYAPNPWGLYQMHGNVWEWCWDIYVGDLTNLSEIGSDNQKASEPLEDQRRVLRGGSWFSDGGNLRSAYRYAVTPGSRDDYIGFRLAGGSALPASRSR